MSADWPYSFTDQVRYGDLDANRHLNNVVVLQFYESARVGFMRSLVPGSDPTHPEQGTGFIFAEAHVNYRSPGFYDETMRTFIRPSHLRRSSVRLEFRMICDEDGRLVAEGWGAIVGYDYAAGRAMPLAPDLIARLRAAGATDADPEEVARA